MVMIQLKLKEKNDWKFQDYNGFKKKIEMIEKYSEDCLKKFLEKTKKEVA